MISIKYQDGMVLGMSSSEAEQMLGYLRYSDYMFSKLAGTGGVASIMYLRLIHHGLMRAFRQPEARAYAEQQKAVLYGVSENISMLWTTPLIVPHLIHTICISKHVVTLWKEYQGNPTELTERLRRRLSKENFPPGGFFTNLILFLQGVEYTSENSTVTRQYDNWDWSSVAPLVFPRKVDLTVWTATTKGIMEVFATHRRVGVGVVEKVLKVKL